MATLLGLSASGGSYASFNFATVFVARSQLTGDCTLEMHRCTGGKGKSPRAPDFHSTTENHIVHYFITPVHQI